MKKYILLMRPQFGLVTVTSVLAGAFAARFLDGVFHPGKFVLTLLAALFLHLANNVINDVDDFLSGNDQANTKAIRPFSGGSGVILEGLVSVRQARILAYTLAFLGAALGLYLNAITPGDLVLWIGLIGFFLVFGYTNLGVRLGYRGLGELMIFLAWGLMVVGSYVVQTGTWRPEVLWVAVPTGLLTMLVLVINEFADREADAAVGRRTWAVLFGERTTLVLYLVSALAAFLVIVLGVFLGHLPKTALLALVALPLPLEAYRHGARTLGQMPAFLKSVQFTILTQVLAVSLLAVGFLLA